ncbi:1-acyl-sn-glycerol-3-phosphate acyltransferase [Litorimonas sp. WD9-15]|uniref:1-acyl-sn-glycerol-3-phosphate acyltransferase n=1 Tax=Litorimonas sp. WD9-15 TaxID=3418716 RepID=UPI003D0578D9
MKYENEFVGPNIPRMGNALTRWIGDIIIKSIGWKLEGRLADEKQIVLIGGPHTSNWDLILAMGTALSVGLKFSWMMKKEAFFWPLGPLWKALGGIPIDRKAQLDVVGQMKGYLAQNEKVWIGITPDGTRAKVDRYKTGYLRIASGTNTPLFIVGIDAKRKTVVLDGLYDLTGDIEADNAAIKTYIETKYNGINPEKT